MELELNKQQIKYKRPVFSEKICHEKTQEVIVSDSLPDIFEIIDTFATAFLRGKDSSSGKATVGGTVEASVIFSAGDGTKTRCIPASIPFTVTADGQEITDNCEIVATVSVASAEAKLVNPRKVLIKVNLCVNVTCYLDSEAEITCNMPSRKGFECLIEETELNSVKNVNEKTFTVSDEFSVGSKAVPGEILAYSAKLLAEDTKPIGSKLIISGRVSSKVIYIDEDSEDVECAEFSTAFSQIVELNNNADNHSTSCEMMLTGAYYSISELSGTGERGILAELNGVIQCITNVNDNLEYLSDIFCTNHKLDVECSKHEALSVEHYQNISSTAQGSIPAAVAPEKIVSVSFKISDPYIKSENDNARALVTATVKVLYCGSDKQLRCAACALECSAAIPSNIEDTSCLSVNAADEIYVTSVGMNFEVRLPITFCISKKERKTVAFVSGVSFDEKEITDNTDRPSITLYRTKEEDTVWSLCKKFMTEKKLLMEANELSDGSSLPANQFLIIPKCN